MTLDFTAGMEAILMDRENDYITTCAVDQVMAVLPESVQELVRKQMLAQVMNLCGQRVIEHRKLQAQAANVMFQHMHELNDVQVMAADRAAGWNEW